MIKMIKIKSLADLIDSMTDRLDGTTYVDPEPTLRKARMQIEMAILIIENNDRVRRNNDPVGATIRALSRIVANIEAAIAKITVRNILQEEEKKNEKRNERKNK